MNQDRLSCCEVLRSHHDEHLGNTAVIAEVNRIGKSRIVLAGLWTRVCIVGPALSALDQGFEVHVITDACGDVSEEAHERAGSGSCRRAHGR